MTLDDFEDALDTYGVRLEDWPDDLESGARVLLDRSAAARAAMAGAKALDSGLRGLTAQPVRAPTGLADRIALTAAAMRTAEIVVFPVERPARPAPVAANTNNWLPTRSAVIAVAAMAVCFVSGILAVQTAFPGNADSESLYVSAVYGDLAW